MKDIKSVRSFINGLDDSLLACFLQGIADEAAKEERLKLHDEISTLQCDIEEMYVRADVDYLVLAEREACAKLVLDDAYALKFQTFGQYRTALAAAIRERVLVNTEQGGGR